jgi:chemotaxis protein MotB
MSKKKKAPPPSPQEGAPEWMVSYADMITIMMAFFVVMYAMAPKKDQEEKESPTQRLMQSIYKRFGPEYEPFGQMFELSLAKPSKDLNEGFGKLDQDPAYTDEQQFTKRREEDLIRIPGRGHRTMVGNIFRFPGNSATLGAEEQTRLEHLARDLAGTPHKIEILAHTSREPLPHDSSFSDHWDLAYQRGRNVMESLARLGIDPDRMRVISAGSSEPVYIGTDPAGLAINSRVEVYMVDLHAHDLVGTKKKGEKAEVGEKIPADDHHEEEAVHQHKDAPQH